MNPLKVDAVIVGGGVAGLWTLSQLVERGFSAILLEANALGEGQTVTSQGIIHGGLKYTLQGLFTSSADAIRDMPQRWRDCLAGRKTPVLQETIVRTDFCHLWRTGRLRSLAGELGARLSLRVRPVKLEREHWPHPLRNCPGDVFRLDEQVIDPVSLLACLAEQNRDRICKIDNDNGVEWQTEGSGVVRTVRIRHPEGDEWIVLEPAAVILTAGAGNAILREQVGLSATMMQRRPLHMVMLRGELPMLNGHCIDAAMTPRTTITSLRDEAGRSVWQIGGQVAEAGVKLGEEELIHATRKELTAVLPGFQFDGLEWATYRVDRAEAATIDRKRPNDVQASREGNVITAWPAKLALAPKLAERVTELLDSPGQVDRAEWDRIRDWPKPLAALPPWEMERTWILDRWETPACA